MTSAYFQHQGFYDLSERRYSGSSSPPRSPRFSSLRRRKRVDYFEDTSEGSDGRTSSDECETHNPQKKIDDNNNNENQKQRKNSTITFSNVKKKITSTFQRRHSVAMHPPSQIQNIHKPPPLRRSSTANHSPSLQRQMSIDDQHPVHIPSQKRKTSLRRTVTMAACRLQEQNQLATDSNSSLNQILIQKSQFQLESCSSTPNISRQNSKPMKTFNIHLLGSTSVGKTALTVRFLTGRYIHEYKSLSEESYSRVMKYGDEQVNVKIHINDIENMKGDIELDQNSGIMILYSVVDRASFTEAKLILQYLAENAVTGHYPVMFIGTKRDLSRMRQVQRKEAFAIANKYSCTQFDVSSATDRRVKDSFHALFRQIEIRHLIHQHDDCGPTIVNPPVILRNGTVRYGTA